MSKKLFWMCSALIIFLIVFDISYKPNSSKSIQNTGVGEALIGGPFTLTSHKNVTVNDSDFRGKFMLVSFGFSNCPEVCPTTLLTITNLMNNIGSDSEKIAPIFITVDPERDTVEQLAKYMENFHPSITALTGSKEQIDGVLSVYRVYAEKIEMEGMEGYMMDHSAYIYLMDKEGKYLTHFPYNISPDELKEKVLQYL